MHPMQALAREAPSKEEYLPYALHTCSHRHYQSLSHTCPLDKVHMPWYRRRGLPYSNTVLHDMPHMSLYGTAPYSCRIYRARKECTLLTSAVSQNKPRRAGFAFWKIHEIRKLATLTVYTKGIS